MSVEKTEVETFFGRCRCCLAYGYLKNMWIEHQFDGEAEVYGEMLVECFALTWEHSEDSMEQDQICEQCIFRLRDASDFKKVVLNSQEELLQEFENENSVNVDIKEERLEEEFLEEYKTEVAVDTTDFTYEEEDTEFDMDTADNMTGVKDETEYEEIEYLEDEDASVVNDAFDTDSSQQTDQSKQVRSRRKQPRHHDLHDVEAPQRKWPKKLPKSERQKTYKQYSEVDLRKCLEEVRNNVLTANEASIKYDIPKKTICAKIRAKPNDVLTDNTTKSNNGMTLRKRSTASDSKRPAEFETKRLTESKIKRSKESEAKRVESKIKRSKESEAKRVESKIKRPAESETKRPKGSKVKRPRTSENKTKVTDIKQDRKTNDEKQVANPDDQKFMYKHKTNIKTVLQYSNATLIKAYARDGFSCNFCDFQAKDPFELKEHNLKNHTNDKDTDRAIKVAYVTDLIMKLDTTYLKCKICKEPFNALEDCMHHLSENHSKDIYTDVKNYMIPFKFEFDDFRCFMCDKDFKYFKHLSEHMPEHYRNFECSICDRGFINKLTMQMHMYRHNKGVFKCSHCPKEFDTRPKRSYHERYAHIAPEKYRQCTFCKLRFSTCDSVRDHEVKAHGVEKPTHTCDDCRKIVQSGSLLKKQRSLKKTS